MLDLPCWILGSFRNKEAPDSAIKLWKSWKLWKSSCLIDSIDFVYFLFLSLARFIASRSFYFGEFGYLNSSCIRKRIVLMLLSSSRDKFTLLLQNWVTDVSVGAHPDVLSNDVSIQISINLGKTFLGITCLRKMAATWLLAKAWDIYLASFVSQILDFTYWTALIFTLIYFEWRNTENQQFTS